MYVFFVEEAIRLKPKMLEGSSKKIDPMLQDNCLLHCLNTSTF